MIFICAHIQIFFSYRPKLCGNNNKDENNSPKTLTDKNIGIICLKNNTPININKVPSNKQPEDNDRNG